MKERESVEVEEGLLQDAEEEIQRRKVEKQCNRKQKSKQPVFLRDKIL